MSLVSDPKHRWSGALEELAHPEGVGDPLCWAAERGAESGARMSATALQIAAGIDRVGGLLPASHVDPSPRSVLQR